MSQVADDLPQPRNGGEWRHLERRTSDAAHQIPHTRPEFAKGVGFHAAREAQRSAFERRAVGGFAVHSPGVRQKLLPGVAM
jgi:hypothetical protein